MLYARYHLRAIGFQPEDNYIWGFGYPSLMQDPSSFGLLAFAPKRHPIWGFGNLCFMQDPPSDYWSSPRSKTRLYMEMTMPWSYGILFGLWYWLAPGEGMSVKMDKGAPKRLSLFVKWRGESSVHSKKECFKVVSTGHRSRVALHPLASLHRH